MDKYIWLLVVIFIFHDMEEIVGMRRFIEKDYDNIITKYPFAENVLKTYKHIRTDAFAFAVYEELILLIVICLLVEFTNTPLTIGIWFGGLIGFIIHLFVHLGQAAAIKKYIPALITSIISIPPSIWLVLKCYPLLTMSPVLIVGICVGIIGVAVNLKFAHFLMRKFNSYNTRL